MVQNKQTMKRKIFAQMYDSPSIVEKDNKHNVVFSGLLPTDLADVLKKSYIYPPILVTVVGIYNREFSLTDVDDFLLEHEECTQEEREYIMEALYNFHYDTEIDYSILDKLLKEFSNGGPYNLEFKFNVECDDPRRPSYIPSNPVFKFAEFDKFIKLVNLLESMYLNYNLEILKLCREVPSMQNITTLKQTNSLNFEDKVERFEFQSSHGIVITDADGLVDREESELSDYLERIHRVDIEELKNYYKLNNLAIESSGDIMDVGFWDKGGEYEKPCFGWRRRTFYNTRLTKAKRAEILKQSFNWLIDNRIF